MSGRFVAGMTIDDALGACERVNREGIAVTLDCLARVAYKMPFKCRFVTRRPNV